jgi:tetratricopeptide (TPR) repeat protein
MLKNEAESVILGETVSPPVNRETLQARRTAWQPIQRLLEAVDEKGGKLEWGAARESLTEAMDMRVINWHEEGNLIVSLHLKAAILFALMEDADRYRALCQELVEPAAISQSPYGRIALWWPTTSTERHSVISPNLLAHAIEMARWKAARISPDERPVIGHDWTWLYLGIAEYRAGEFGASLEALEKARHAFNLAASGTAYAFSALVSAATGQSEDAVAFLSQAESLHEQILAGNPDGLGRHWHDVAVLELALREARAVLAETMNK